MSKFYITNSFDKPCERLITELAEDGLLYYIHPELREKWKNTGLSLRDEATAVEDFGLDAWIKDGVFYGFLEKEPKATYPDGRRRFWQGEASFSFNYPGPLKRPQTTPFDLFDRLDKPSDVGAAEYTAIYDLLMDGPECANDPDMAIAVCQEFIDHAQDIINRIQDRI